MNTYKDINSLVELCMKRHRMGTYKDTDALVELIDYYIFDDKDAYKNHSALFIDGMKDGYYRVRSGIINLPVADVAEVVHGEWIKMDKRGNNVQCSKCRNTLDLRGVNAGRGDANFCPNCGAKMERREDG